MNQNPEIARGMAGQSLESHEFRLSDTSLMNSDSPTANPAIWTQFRAA